MSINRSAGSEPIIKLTCLAGNECMVYFEPWGTEYVLARGEVFEVSSAAFSTGDVEVSYLAGGISLAFSSDADVTVTDGAGRTFRSDGRRFTFLVIAWWLWLSRCRRSGFDCSRNSGIESGDGLHLRACRWRRN